MKTRSSLAEATGFFGLYALYVFLAGHAFFESYYETFGIDPRWLDFGFTEVMVRGFTALFLRPGVYLWPIYIFVFISPIVFELISQFRRKPMLQAFIIAVLLALFPATYFVAANAGNRIAAANKDNANSLPFASFSIGTEKCFGRLLLVRGGMVFVHQMAVANQSGQPDSINLHVYRIEEIKDFEVTERPE